MTLTSTIAKIGSGADVNFDIPTLDQSKLLLQGTTVDATARTITSEYVYADGDVSVPVNVSVRIAYDKASSGKAAYKRMTIRLESRELVSDSVSGVTTVGGAPIQIVTTINVPIGSTITVAELLKMIGNAQSLLYPSFTSGAASDDHITALGFDVTALYG